MASKYSIQAVFELLDKFSAPLYKAQSKTSAFCSGFQRDVDKAKMKWTQLGQTIKTVGKVAIGAGIAAAGAGLVDSTKKYVDFEDSITKAGSKFADLDVTSADFGEHLEQLQKAAREVGAVTKYSASDAAGALDKMAMAGISSDKAMSMLMGTTNLATAAGTDLTTAVDIATDALGIYGNALAKKGLSTVEEQLDKISDVMAKTGVMANTDLQGLFDAMTYAGPSFVAAGQDIETLSAAIGTLSNAGIKGSAAGTALNAVFTQLGKADKIKALSELGVDVKDSSGNFRNLLDIVADVEKATANMGNVEKKSLLNSIFDTRGEKAITTMMAAGSASIKDFEAKLRESGGTANAIARAQEKSLKGQIATLQSAIEDKQLSFGKAIAENGGSTGLQKLIEMVQNWDPTPVINFMTAVMDKLPAILGFLGGLVSTLWNFKDLIGFVVAGLMTYKAVTMAAAVAQTVYTTVTAAAAAGQLSFNAILMANPIGVVIAAITALAFGVYELVKHWDDVCAVMQKVWDVIKNAVCVAFEWLLNLIHSLIDGVFNLAEKFGIFMGPLGMMLNVVHSLVENIGYIKSAFTDGGILNGILAIGKAILNGLLTPIHSLLEMMSHIPGVGKWAGKGADAIAAFQDSLFEPVEPVTAGDRVAYSSSEINNTVDLNVSLDKGLKGSVSGTAPNININQTASAAY